MVYYVRTFALRMTQLVAIVTSWETSSRHYNKSQNWLNYIQRTASPEVDPILYIRYVGMAKGHEGAWERFAEDLKDKSGIMAAFLDKIVNNYPDVFDKSTCHELVSASYPLYIPPEEILMDDRERVLIALFNRDLLLNERSKGFYSAGYTPLARDQQLFATLNTKFFDTFWKRADAGYSDSSGVRVQLAEWAQNVRNYALHHPVETLTNRFPLTDSYFQTVLKLQTMPSIFKGKPLMVLFGKAVTIQDLTAEKTFLSSDSRAGKLTVDLLATVHQFENGYGQQLVGKFCDEDFPFVDMFPWIGKSNPEAAIEFAREYFSLTKPRIIVTFSRLVSSWTAAHFHHPYGLPT
jgi:hypothetical protein